MIQQTLTGEKAKEKKKRNWVTKKRIDTVYENCLNCGKELKFAIFEEAENFDEKTGRPLWDMGAFIHGEQR